MKLALLLCAVHNLAVVFLGGIARRNANIGPGALETAWHLCVKQPACSLPMFPYI